MSEINQNIDVKTSLQTTLILTPQMKHSLNVLQMPIVELNQEISTFLETNPLLEIDDGSDDFEDFDDDIDGRDTDTLDENDPKEEDLVSTVSSDEWEEYIGYEKMDDISYKTTSDEDAYDLEQFVSSKESLSDHLFYQLKISVTDEKLYKICEYIIGNLEDDGYFREDFEFACAYLSCDLDDFNKGLKIIQSFSPTGVGATSLEECIIIQLKEMGLAKAYLNVINDILVNYKKELASFKYSEIAKKVDIEPEDMDYILDKIKKTDPKPGLNFSSNSGKFVTPDVFIVPNEENFDIIINNTGIPELKINSYYTKMLKDNSLDDEAKSYIKEKVKGAASFIDAINKRESTLAKVVKVILQFQGDFLKYGIDKLKPLRLREVAEITGLNESTISRATSGKYAMTKHGLVELKLFFSRSLDQGEGEMSIAHVKKILKEIIDSENETTFYTDSDLVECMAEKGIKIARRTITKYREDLNIPTMTERKRLRR